MKSESFSSANLPQEFYEYLLVVHPGTGVYEKVLTEKQWFYEEFKEAIAIKTKPHITVANFIAREPMEETIIRWMQRGFRSQPAFTVTLNNYSGFPPHTIYLRIQDKQPFRQLAGKLEAIDTYITSCSCPPMRLIYNPHLSIARGLSQETYFKALTQYAHKSFHESFVVNELLLLRRRDKYDKYETINVFGLQPSAKELFIP